MIYYLVRHKATLEFMPQLRRGRGYSHWNPAIVKTSEAFTKKSLVGVPRLFPTERSAKAGISAWAANPNAKSMFTQSYDGEVDEDIRIKYDGRKKEDLEAVEVRISL